LKKAKDVSALKAISQNLMHENLSMTDGVYGIRTNMDVRDQIKNLSKENLGADLDDEMYQEL